MYVYAFIYIIYVYMDLTSMQTRISVFIHEVSAFSGETSCSLNLAPLRESHVVDGMDPEVKGPLDVSPRQPG